jgi:two-component system nitrogen regulation response regulator NtrX
VIGEIVSRSAAMALLAKRLRASAPSRKPRLFVGPSGSGRRFLAKSLHQRGPWVELSGLGPLPLDDLIAAARQSCGGTLLVTDLEELDGQGQRDLLFLIAKCSTLGDPPRLMATAQPSIALMVAQGRFSRSLYDQVSVLRHRVPSLQERMDDLPELCRLLLASHAHEEGRKVPALLPDGLDALRCYDWPGNVQELSNVLFRALWLDSAIDGFAVGELLSGESAREVVTVPLGSSLAQAEKALILGSLSKFGNKALTARVLGITRRTLYLKLARFGHQ